MKTLLLIDANALIHRAFHALPPLTTPDGEPVGAIYGVSSILIKALKDIKPDYVAAAFDRPEPTFREEMFKEYKIHRPPAPDELVHQIIKARELFEVFQIPFFEKAGFEADDIIGTLAKNLQKGGEVKIIILTGDLDALQLVRDDKVVVLTMKKGVSETFVYNEEAVKARYGLGPEQLPDYKGFVGDPSDNIPGVRGVGPKTATQILSEYGNLENVYKKIEPGHPLAKKLLPYKDMALLSKKLGTIKCDVPLEFDLEKLNFPGLGLKKLTEYFTKLGFQSLVARILKNDGAEGKNAIAPATSEDKNFIIISEVGSAIKNKSLLSSQKIKIAFDWKPLLKEFIKRGVFVEGPLFDLKVAGWLLDPDQKDLTLEALSKRFLYKPAAENTYQELFGFFQEKIKGYGLDFVFEKIEMPLVPILAEIEEWGIKVNVDKLGSLKEQIGKELENLAQKIYKGVGASFNINSPKQVSQILFEKLQIRGGEKRKTTTGKRSTAERALLDLRGAHPVIDLLLEYREGFKIRTAFVSPILELVKKDGRVHTTFSQTGTATGRLSSLEPNLQNIPQESKWSKALRSAFEAETGSSLLSFDYSQLELRLLSHVTGDPKLKEAFEEGIDIHKLTASQVFNTTLEKVTPEMRRLGKTLNFGIVYGMGAKSFSETSGLAPDQAKKFINEYFNDFPSIKTWQESIKSEAQAFGYIKNLNGRRRWFLNPGGSYKSSGRGEIERAAINMPIQSLGADIIKLAMIESFLFLKEQGWLGKKAKILLSIHDELLLEIDDDILKETAQKLKDLMEKVYPLSVPLKVEIKSGKNWGDMKTL